MKYKKEGLLPYLSVNNNVFGVVDMQGFTKLTESFVEDPVYGAERISELIQEIFTPAVNFVVKNKGNIIGFTGDGFVFSLKDGKSVDALKTLFENILSTHNRKYGRNISFRIDIFDKPLHIHSIKTERREFFFYHYDSNDKGKPSSIDYNKVFPEEVFDIFETEWLGKLVEVPIGFINIDRAYNPFQLGKLFEEIVNKAYMYKVYINKILYENKGWDILISAGDPVFVENSPKIIIAFLKDVFAKFGNSIAMKAGVTLDRVFAGIIGSPARWEYTFIGRGVNLASRISTALKPGKIGVDATFKNKTLLYFSTKRIMTFKPKGFDHEEVVYDVSLRKRTKTVFAGREESVRDIAYKLESPLTCVYIEGTAGVGKTALAHEILKRLKKPYISLHGEINSVTLASFESFLNRTGEIYKYISGIRRKQLYRSLSLLKNEKEYVEFIKDVLLAVKEDVILFIDDLPYLDRLSLSIVRWMLTTELRHINLIFTGRDFKDINFLSSRLNVYKLEKIELSGLRDDELNVLIEQLTGGTPRKDFLVQIKKMTEGNPLFVLNIIDYLKKHNRLRVKANKLIVDTDFKDIPYSLKEFILKRLNELETDVRKFLEVGSIVGDNFETDIVLKAADIADEKSDNIVNKAIMHKMITVQNAMLSSFYHALIRETVFYRLLRKEVVALINSLVTEYEKKGNVVLLYKAGRLLEEHEKERAKELYFKALDLAIKKKRFELSFLSFKRLLKMTLKEGEIIRLVKYTEFMKHVVWDMDTLKDIERSIEKLSRKAKRELSERMLWVANILLQNLRDFNTAYELLKTYRTIVKRRDTDYYYILAQMYYMSNKSNIADKLYNYILKHRFSKNIEDQFNIYASLLEFYFLYRVNYEKVKLFSKKLSDVVKRIESPALLLRYFGLMSTIYLHWQEYDKAEKYVFKVFSLAKKLRNKDAIADSYNNLAIIYGDKALKYGDKSYRRLSVMYSKRVYKILKKGMVLNALPLITTNLATTYMKIGNFKNAYKYYKEGLLYGEEINHPVEVPFTLTMLSKMLLGVGAYNLSYELVKDIKDTDVIDLRTYSYLLRYYFKTKDKKDIDLAFKKAMECHSQHIPTPLIDFVNISYIIKYQLRENFSDFVAWVEPLRSIEDKSIADIVKSTLKYIEKIKTYSINKKDFERVKQFLDAGNFGVRSLIVVIEYARCIFKKDKKEAISIFKYALRIARRMKAFPYEKIVYGYFIDEGYNVSYYKRRLSIVEERLRKINSAKTIDDFDRIIHDM